MKTNKIDQLKDSDPILAKIITKKIIHKKNGRTVYESLLSSIISQQISVKAADAIRGRFLILFKNKYPSPETVLKTKEVDLFSCGLSKQKVQYIKNVARHFKIEELNEKKFLKLSNEEIISDLTKIKGVGRWTVEMILMFSLGRGDVFSVGDGGLQNALIKLYKINKSKMKKKNFENKLFKISEKWSPNRTLACLYLWDYKDGV